MSKEIILQKYKQPFKELIDKYKNILEKDISTMSAWERSTYREIMKYANK